MKRLGFCALLFGGLVSVIAAQSRSAGGDVSPAASTRGATPVAPRATAPAAVHRPMAAHRTSAAAAGAPAAQQIFEKYCSDCHTGGRAKGNIDFDKLTERMTPTGV